VETSGKKTTRGLPRGRLLDVVEEDLNKMGSQERKELFLEKWREIDGENCCCKDRRKTTSR